MLLHGLTLPVTRTSPSVLYESVEPLTLRVRPRSSSMFSTLRVGSSRSEAAYPHPLTLSFFVTYGSIPTTAILFVSFSRTYLGSIKYFRIRILFFVSPATRCACACLKEGGDHFRFRLVGIICFSHHVSH